MGKDAATPEPLNFFCTTAEPCTLLTSLYTKMHLPICHQTPFLETTLHLHLTGRSLWPGGSLHILCHDKQLGIWESKLHFAGCPGANPCKMDVKCSEEVRKHTLVWNSDCLTPNQVKIFAAFRTSAPSHITELKAYSKNPLWDSCRSDAIPPTRTMYNQSHVLSKSGKIMSIRTVSSSVMNPSSSRGNVMFVKV